LGFQKSTCAFDLGISVLGRQGMIVSRVIARPLLDPPPDCEPAVVAWPLVVRAQSWGQE